MDHAQYRELREFLETGAQNAWAYIFDNPFIGVTICDHSGRILRANAAHAYVTGRSGAELIGLNMGDVVKSGYLDRSLTMEVLKCGHSLLEEQTRPGRSYMVKTDPIRNEQGEIAYVVSLLMDVSLERSLKAHLEKTREGNAHMQRRIADLQLQLDAFKEAGGREEERNLLYVSKELRDVHAQIFYIAKSSSAVLITGESGVGKELAARTIQRTSDRRDKSFISINCAAMPSELLESELFGYVSGAFTDSRPGGKAGLFESVQGGTILLDEIGEMPRKLQAKLLRVLQEKEVRRVGGTENIPVDVRIIAATNQDLEDLIARGRFRADLYYRLNVLPIYIPPLRERREDIPILSYFFLDAFNRKYGKSKQISHEGYNYLVTLPYRGNVRQLENTIERLVLLCQEDTVLPADIESFYSMTEKMPTAPYSLEGESPAGWRQALERSGIPVQGIAFAKGAPPVDWKRQVQEEELRLIENLAAQGLSSYQIAAQMGMKQPTVWRRLRMLRNGKEGASA